MIDWKSAAEIARDDVAFNRLTHALLGVYVWEWLISLSFDWHIITGKKPFKWPLIFYFLNRYTLFFSLMGMVIALNATTEINCQLLASFNQVLAGTAFVCASINLSLRTMAVWSQKWYIVYPLLVLIFGHIVAMLHGIFLKSKWIPGQGCVITHTVVKSFLVGHIYTMTFDFIVMSLTAIQLVLLSSGSRSRLRRLVFQDGLIYFILAFLSNLLVTIFMVINLNPVMSIMVNGLALVISTIVACRVVRRLSNYSAYNPETFRMSTKVSTLAFLSHTSGTRTKNAVRGVSQEGVHIATFPAEQEQSVFPERDTRTHFILGNTFDSEAKVEFKYLP